jgi:uncharacterized protein (UPF0332 family)
LGSSDQADLRTAVSRAYYAAFHVARDFLTALGFQTPNGEQAHGYLWLRLSNCGDAKVAQAGHRLKDLRRKRNQADYDLQRTIRQGIARSDFQIAADIIRLIDSLTALPLRTQIRDAMIVYERDVLKDVTWRP